MARRVEQFFFGRDTTPWHLIRIGSGFSVLLTMVLLGISGNYERLYGHWGMLPRTEALDAVYWPAFIFLMKSDPAWIWRIYWATIVASLCLTVGIQTRLAAIATWFLYVATIQRNLISYNGEAGVLGFLLVSLIFAPTPQRWSLDQRFLHKALPVRSEIWPARFVQINLCIMYFFTTVGKVVGQWDVGTGEIWYHITLCDWFRFTNAEWFRWGPLCWLAVHGSLAVEGSFAFLVWTRLRLPLVLAVMALHCAIIILFCNALFFFNLAAITALCSFLRQEDFERLRRVFTRPTRRRVPLPVSAPVEPPQTVTA